MFFFYFLQIHINLQDYDTKLYQNIEDMDA